jgi:ATP-binding cassette, subfamily B, bacterial
VSVLTDQGPDVDAFVPIGVQARFGPPRGAIHPDPSRSWLRRAAPLVWARKTTFVASLTLAFVGLVLQVEVPNLLNQAIDQSLVRHRTSLTYYVTLITALSLAAGLSAFVARLLLMRTAYGVEFDLRSQMHEHLSGMSFEFFDRVQTGQLISRANSDIRSVQMYLTFAPFILVQCAIGVVAFAFLLAISVPLAFVALATTPAVFWIGARMRQQMFPVSWLIQSRLADVATIVDENVSGIRVVKSFAAESSQINALARAAERLRWAYVKDADLRARYAPAVQNLPQVSLILGLLLGGYLVINEHLGVGVILAFSAYVVMLQAPFQMLGMLVMLGQRAAASAARIFEILDERPAVVEAPDAVALSHVSGDVRFGAVSFGYLPNRPPVLDDFTLVLKPGETTALVGRIGSGKSTVARLLARFYDVAHGAIRIDGVDIRDATLTSLRASVGVVMDEPFLFSASIRDNIAYGRPDASDEDVAAAARAASCYDFVLELPDGFATVVGERGYTLSGGQRQRVALARSLLVNPPILVLDDATSAIDAETEASIHAALRLLMRKRTTLIIAHRLSTIALADRVVVLDDGRVVADGPHATLMATVPLYREILAQATAEPAA